MKICLDFFRRRVFLLYGTLVLVIAGLGAFWSGSHTLKTKWHNVPVAPSASVMVFSSLGDKEVAYRTVGYILQNEGNVGGEFQALQDYNYKQLERWFFLSQSLDARADFVPYLAAYYFGALEYNLDKLDYVISYLSANGQLNYPQKWRWLAHAAYLARYRQKDREKALELANIIKDLPGKDVAMWARQMPAFIYKDMGEKEAANNFMLSILQSDAENLDHTEVNEMMRFICKNNRDLGQKDMFSVCDDLLKQDKKGAN